MTENNEEVIKSTDGQVHQAVPEQPITELEKLIKESNLPKTKSEVLLSRFNHYFAMAAAREKQLETLKVTDVTQVTEMKLAGEMRKACKRDRTAIEKARKELNEDAQAEITITNAIAKVLTALLSPLETKAEEIEKFAEKETARLKGIKQAERQAIADQYGGSGNTDLSIFSDEEWGVYLNGLRAVYEARLEKEEQERERQAKLAELQKERLATLSALPFRLNLEPYGYDKLYAYDQEEWTKIVDTANAYQAKLERIDQRKNALIELGVQVPVLGTPIKVGKVEVMYEHLEHYGVTEWASLVNDLQKELDNREKLRARQNELVGLGFRFIAAQNEFVAPPRLANLGIKDVTIADLKDANDEVWSALVARIRKIEEDSAQWMEIRLKQLGRIQSYGEVLGQVEGDDADFFDYKAIKTMENGLLDIPWNISFKYPRTGAMKAEDFTQLSDRMENYFRITRKWLMYVEDPSFTYDPQSRTFNNVECGITVDIIKDVKELDMVAFNKKYKEHCEKINERFFRHKMRTEELETYGVERKNNKFVYDKTIDQVARVYVFPPDILDMSGSDYSDAISTFQKWLNPPTPTPTPADPPVASVGNMGGSGTLGSGRPGGAPTTVLHVLMNEASRPQPAQELIPLTDSEKLDLFADDFSVIRLPEMTTPRGEQALKNALLLRDKLVAYIKDAAKALK